VAPGGRREQGSAGPGSEGPSDRCPTRHCWVSDAADGAGVRRPGLLVEWRQPDRTGAGWEGRVVYAAQVRADSWVLVEEWLPAALLTPR
jgi:hypothetical protein